jgi:ABC-type bacteriocin/lantibiotic exporter with double-glycine peptidase domain
LVRSFALPAQSSQSHENHQERLQGHLDLEDLSYSFNPVSPPFISNLSLSIPAGSQLAIVGGSGSGKTTLIRVLAGLYQPSGGRLLFDGKPWEHHGDRLMRDSLAYVPQQVFMFNASIHDNITLWRSGYRLQDLEEAASDAQILNTITSHPEAFARHLKDNGSDLSGGERQRMELCRALLRRPSILLLDEATSALDNATQMRVLDALKARRLTVVSVAHRLDAALRSDQVLVMAQGAVVELGSPQELLDQNGAFRALVDSEHAGQGVA